MDISVLFIIDEVMDVILSRKSLDDPLLALMYSSGEVAR